MKTENLIIKRIYMFVTIIIFAGILKPATAQIPHAMEKDMDNINEAIYEALVVIDTKSEAEALKQLAFLNPKIQVMVSVFEKKWGGTELSDEQEVDFGKKLLEKQLYKNLYALIAKPSFQSKIETSPAMKKQYGILMAYMDKGDSEEEIVSDPPVNSGSGALSFTVEGDVPYTGTYMVKGNKEETAAQIDDNNLFAVKVAGTLNGGEFQFVILAEKAIPGEHKWSMESQVIIQSWDEDQNEVIQLSNYYNEGSINFDKIEGVGGKVTGSFTGKFFDDTQATDQPVTVKGKFSVTRVKNADY